MLSIFFFNDTATTEIYTLSLHDALPILAELSDRVPNSATATALGVHDEYRDVALQRDHEGVGEHRRSEEHTSELQSQSNLVCRLLLEKKKEPLSAALHSPIKTL